MNAKQRKQYPPIADSQIDHFPIVTTHSGYGGIGLGRNVAGVVYQSGGNGWFYAQPQLTFDEDNGRGYRAAIRAMFNCDTAWKGVKAS